MKRALVFLFVVAVPALAVMELIAACSGADVKVPDAATEAAVDAGFKPDCGPLPMLTCLEGAPGKACGDFPQPFKTTGSGPCPMYVCGPGTVSVNECACQAKTYKIEAGADCPGDDASTD